MSAIQGKRPSGDEEFYLGWALESVKASHARLDEIMKQLLSLSSGLLGIDLVFELVPNSGFKIWIAFPLPTKGDGLSVCDISKRRFPASPADLIPTVARLSGSDKKSRPRCKLT